MKCLKGVYGVSRGVKGVSRGVQGVFLNIYQIDV
jgi:hypothetical protein